MYFSTAPQNDQHSLGVRVKFEKHLVFPLTTTQFSLARAYWNKKKTKPVVSMVVIHPFPHGPSKTTNSFGAALCCTDNCACHVHHACKNTCGCGILQQNHKKTKQNGTMTSMKFCETTNEPTTVILFFSYSTKHVEWERDARTHHVTQECKNACAFRRTMGH